MMCKVKKSDLEKQLNIAICHKGINSSVNNPYSLGPIVIVFLIGLRKNDIERI